MRTFIKYIITILLVTGSVCAVSAQSKLRSLMPREEGIRDNIGTGKKRLDTSASRNNGVALRGSIPSGSRSKAADDTVYCHSTAKQHGWFKPLGILTKEQVSHRSRSYMFTGKNEKGHWTKMESVDALGRHVPSGSRPYIAKSGSDEDSLFNKDWDERLGRSCIFEFIPDPSGENIIQERDYDKDYNLIYAYSRIPVGNNQYIGSYKDYYGLPAEMRDSKGFSYGTLVRITEDKWGNDARIEYIDSKGSNKPNADGAYAEVFEYNESGEYMIKYSIDSVGNRIRDNWGNCAVRITYGRNHLVESGIYLDEKMMPMRMPSEKSGNLEGTIKIIYEYDGNFRHSAEIFVTDSGAPDTNKYGCHRITYEYDSLGNIIRQTGYDLDGKLVAQDGSGSAKYIFGYNDRGDLIKVEYLDEKMLPVSTPGYLSKYELLYDKSGNQVGETRWIVEDGVEKISYSERTDTVDGCRREITHWQDGDYRLKRYDEKGRQIFSGSFDSSDKPVIFEGDEWAFKTIDYTDIAPGKTVYREFFYDETGNPASAPEYDMQNVLCDSLTQTEYYRQYKNDVLVNTFSKKFDKDFVYLLEQVDNNAFGVISRSGGISGVRYYNAKVKWTPFSEISYIVGLDEFDEPDYIVTDNGDIYYYSRSGTYMSIDNEAIDSEKNRKLRDSLPKVMTIEVIDSCAYNLGIRDNDVILSYGSYKADLVEPLSDDEFKVDWTVRNVVESGEPRDMVVFRVEDGPAGKFGLDTIRGLVGPASQLGFITHTRYLTQKQTDRMTTCFESVSASEVEKTRRVVILYPELFRNQRNRKYESEIIDPAVLLGTCDKRRDLRWNYRGSAEFDDLIAFLKVLNKPAVMSTDKHLFFAKDSQGIVDFQTEGWIDIMDYLFVGSVEETLYEKLLDQCSEASQRIDDIFAGASRIDRKLLSGYWLTEKEDSVKHNASGYLYFEKDGACKGEVKGYAYVPDSLLLENYGSPVFTKIRNFDGKWSETDNLIFFRPEDEENCVIGRCVDILNPTGEVQAAIDYFNEDYPKYYNYYNRKMSALCDIDNEAMVKHVDKRTLILEDNYGNEIRFLKQKGKNKPEMKGTATNPADSIIGSWAAVEEDSEATGSLLLTFDKEDYVKFNMYIMAGDVDESAEKVALSINVEADGRWEMKSDKITVDIDTSTIRCNLNYINFGPEENLERLAEAEGLLDGFKSNFADNFGNSLVIRVNEAGEMNFDGLSLYKVDANKTIICGSIEGDEGYLVTSGMTGNYLVLQWGGWDCRMDLPAFESEFEKSRNEPKSIMLLPFASEDEDIVFGNPVVIECPEGPLGIRLRDLNGSYNFFFNEILRRYLMMK